MKKIGFILAMIFSIGVYAQNEVTTYFDNGNIKMDLVKVGDRSVQTLYYETGEIKQTGTFVNNLPSGVWKTYNTDGNVLSEGFYTDGKKIGKWVIYNANSEAKYELYYEDGKRVDAIALK